MKCPPKALGGVINVYKEAGWTSFDVVALVRRLFGSRRVGHCGTLDPFAEGVLPVFIGRATSLVRYTGDYDKSYRVEVAFGQATETQDGTGAVIGGRTPDVAEIRQFEAGNWAALRSAVSAMTGRQLQVPPMYSAVKIGGQPLYKYARRGETIDRPAREIHVYRAELTAVRIVEGPAPIRATVEVDCSKGTYIRTLCSDLGERLGWGAHAAALERTACGPFQTAGAWRVDQLREWCAEVSDSLEPEASARLFSGRLCAAPIQAPEAAIQNFPVIKLATDQARRLLQGQRLPVPASLSGCRPGDRCRAVGAAGFLGMAVIRSGPDGDPVLAAERMLADIDDYIS